MYAGQLILSGLLTGAAFALMAVGLTVVYRASNVLNFAHGYIAALVAFVSLSLAKDHHLGWPASITIALAVGIAVAILTEVLVIHVLRTARPLSLLVATLAVALVCDGVIEQAFGTQVEVYPPLVAGRVARIAGLDITYQAAIVLLVAVAALVVLALMFERTRLGLSMRALGDSPVTTALLGVPTRFISIFSWALGGLLAGVAGVLLAPRVSLTADSLTQLMVEGFASVVLAGFTSITSAVLGGILTGVVLNLVSGYLISDAPNTTLFVLLLIVLLARPNGLFGRSEDAKL